MSARVAPAGEQGVVVAVPAAAVAPAAKLESSQSGHGNSNIDRKQAGATPQQVVDGQAVAPSLIEKSRPAPSCCDSDWSSLPEVNPCCASPERPCCVKGESCTERAFEGIGVEVAKRPWLSILLSSLLVAACATGFAFSVDENRPELLWIPTGAPALFHADFVESMWPAQQRFAFYIASCADVEDPNDCNILEAKYVREMNRINEEIYDIVVNSTHALELAGIEGESALADSPYDPFYSFAGDEDAGVSNKCFLLGSTGAVCGESSVLATFRNDIPDDLTDEQVVDTVNFYPTQQRFCPLTISDPTSPCRNATAYNPSAAPDACQVYDASVGDGSSVPTCQAAFTAYCNDKCPNWLSPNGTVREQGCVEETCARSSWYLVRTDPIPTFTADLSSMLSSGENGPTRDSSGRVISAQTMFGYYMLSTTTIVLDGSNVDPISDEWEKAALCKLGIVSDEDDPVYNSETCTREDALLKFTAQFSRSLGDTFGAAIVGDVPKLGAAMGLIMVYLFVMLSRRDYVHSMIGMSVVALIVVGLSYAGCIGLGSYLGLRNNNLNLNIPFLLLGLGVDDAFVISAEFFRTYELYPTMPLRQRTVYAMKHGGVSVLITSATDALAFLVGSSTVLPALGWFCGFAGLGIIFCFLLQIFVFVPALQLNAIRAEQNRFDFWCCCKSKRDHPYMEPLGCCGCCRPQWCATGVLGRIMFKFGELVTTTAGIVVTLIGFFALLAVGIWGATQLYKDFQLEWFVPADSYLSNFYEENAAYFESGVSFSVYTKETFDYFDAQSSFVALHARMTSEPYMDIDAGVTDWHHSFMAMQMRKIDQWHLLQCFDTASGLNVTLNANNSNTPGEVHCLYTNRTAYYRDIMAWYEEGGWNLESGNLRWVDPECNSCGGSCSADETAPLCNYDLGINSTKVSGTLLLNATTGGQTRYDTMIALRKMVAECFPTYDADGQMVEGGTLEHNEDELAFPYNFNFLYWEEVGTIDVELWRNLAVCCAVVVAVVLMLIPKPRVAVFVILAIIMSIVDILGLLFFWGITISGVSTIYVLVSVGLAVDYSAHIAHMFAESKGRARERAINALGRIGPSVFNAVFSTLCAVIVLATSDSFIYEVFFKVLCLTVLVAGGHGLWFLPAILALGGGDRATDSEIEVQDVELGKGAPPLKAKP